MNEQLRKIVADTLGLDPAAVTPGTSRASEPAWDSLAHLRLITAIEEAFGVRLTMAEVQGIESAADLEARIADGHGGR